MILIQGAYLNKKNRNQNDIENQKAIFQFQHMHIFIIQFSKCKKEAKLQRFVVKL